jgi:DNA-binding response OmpR family regulator
MASSKDILRVLVADDEIQICTLIREALTQASHYVELCHDGEEVLRKLQSGGKYGLLILDVLMPRKTGVEVVHELRKKGEGIPILLMSSFMSEEVLGSCSALDRIAFLQKPFSLTDLRATVERLTRPVHS